jgi:hypothetical protein
MFVPQIEYLNKNMFGINFKAEDIKCNINKKQKEKNLKKEPKDKIK